MRGLNEYYPLGTPVSFICLSGENRRAATASKFGNGSRVTVASLSPPFRSSQITYRYTGGFISAGAAQGELPEGQERVLWSMTVPRKPFSGANWLQPQDLDNLHR